MVLLTTEPAAADNNNKTNKKWATFTHSKSTFTSVRRNFWANHESALAHYIAAKWSLRSN